MDVHKGLKPLPLDRNSGNAIQGGTINHVFTVSMTGSYIAITIPDGQECKAISIKMQDSSEFLFSHTDVATVPYMPYSALSMDLTATENEVIGYANAASGTLAVHLLK